MSFARRATEKFAGPVPRPTPNAATAALAGSPLWRTGFNEAKAKRVKALGLTAAGLAALLTAAAVLHARQRREKNQQTPA